MGVAPATLWSWGDDQVDLLLASVELERGFGQYGEDRAEAMSGEANPNNYSGSFYYKAVGPRINWAEKIVAEAQEAHYGDSQQSRAGHVWGVERVERPSVGGALPLVYADDESPHAESGEK